MTVQIHSLQPANAPRARKLAPWRFWTTIVTIAAFLSLLLTVSSHQHLTQAEDQDCAICSVVTHKTVDLPTIDLPKQVLVFVSYVAFQSLEICSIHVSPALLPPSCGTGQDTCAHKEHLSANQIAHL